MAKYTLIIEGTKEEMKTCFEELWDVHGTGQQADEHQQQLEEQEQREENYNGETIRNHIYA